MKRRGFSIGAAELALSLFAAAVPGSFGQRPVGMPYPGVVRHFRSPPLDPAKAYVYEVRAHWNENGREANQTRRVPVHAGDMITVNFMQAEQR